MSLEPVTDVPRVQFLLRDLLKSTQGQAPMVELSPVAGATALQGVASRSGLLRLGLRLALEAIEADTTVSVYADGRVIEQGESHLERLDDGQSVPAVISILLSEDATSKRPSNDINPWFISALSIFVLMILVFAFIGFVSVVKWFQS